MAKKVPPKALPEGLDLNINPTLIDDDGEAAHPLSVKFLRSIWTEGVMTYEGGAIRLREKGRSIILTASMPTYKLKADMHLASIITLWDELEESLRLNKLNWEQDYISKERSRQKLDNPIE